MGQVIQMRDYQAKRKPATPTEIATVFLLDLPKLNPAYDPFFAMMSLAVADPWIKAFFLPGGIDDIGL
jgi:hypothetical protein